MIKSEEIKVAGMVLLSFAIMLGTALKASDTITFIFPGAILQIGICVALLHLTVSQANTSDVLAVTWAVIVGGYPATYLYNKNMDVDREAKNHV